MSKNIMFSLNKFDDGKVQMQSHLSALHDKIWEVITNGLVEIMMANVTTAT